MNRLICALPILFTLAMPAEAVVLNELLVSHTGTDDSEYVELHGTAGESLAGLSLINVEGDSNSNTGHIDWRIDFKPFHRIGSNGFFLVGNCNGLAQNYQVTPDKAINNNTLENSSSTYALVRTASLTGEQVTGQEAIIDSIALTDGGTQDQFFFDAPVVGPDGRFIPAGVRRIQDGVDTNQTSDWIAADFNLGGANTPRGGGLDGCQPLPASIAAIQGDQGRSSYENEYISTRGIITQFSTDNNHFWLQDAQDDNNPQTSEGIFVVGAGNHPLALQVGDEISLTAQVQEQQFGNGLPLTRLHNVSDVARHSSHNALPEPVTIKQLPDENISEAIRFWQALEGMRVSLNRGLVVGPTTGFDEFVIISKKNARRGSGYQRKDGLLLLTDKGNEQIDYNPERIMVARGRLPTTINAAVGDSIDHLLGVVDYSFGNFKIQAQQLQHHSGTQSVEESEEDHDHGLISVANYNVENLFDLNDDPLTADQNSTPGEQQLESKLNKLAGQIVHWLRTPAIISVQEIENSEILQQLANRINALADTDYLATSLPSSDQRGIEVGFLWDKKRVMLKQAYTMTGDAVSNAFGPNSESPGREPLVGIFIIDNEELIIIGNHFKSKGQDDPLFGIHQPAQRVTEIQRKLQAWAVRDHVNELLMQNPKALLLVNGDLNDFRFSEPGEGRDNPVAILEHGHEGDIPLYHFSDRHKHCLAYSYNYQGNAQLLDHALLSPALYKRLKRAEIVHINADYPQAWADDPMTLLRASDHDPVVLHLQWRGRE